ncbi:MAG: tripartite tricarboxylate transporter TctB family protein [Pseudomonadota bacterium]
MSRFLTERVVLATLLLAAPLILLAVSVGAQFAELGGAFSPMFFPATILWFWAGIAALGLAAELRATGAVAALPPRRRWQIAGAVAAMGAFVWGTTTFGFLLSAIAFTAAILLMLGIRTPVLVVAYSVLMPGAIFTLFNHVLKLPLPTSPFTHLF